MKPFFSLDKVKSNVNPKNPQSCVSCGFYKDCKSPRMKPYGKNRKNVLWLGDNPTELDDKRNKPWQGRIGQLLQKTTKKFGFDLFRDGLSYNACNCFSHEDTSFNNIHCCRLNVIKTIKKHKPKVIFLLQDSKPNKKNTFGPIDSIIGHRWKKGLGGITKWRGWHIPDQDFNCWVCPVFHPNFVLRKEDRQGRNLALKIWERDIYNALQLINKPVPDYSNVPMEFITDYKRLKDVLIKAKKADLVSFDYETTGIKPQNSLQKLVSTSIAFDNKCYAWMNVKKVKGTWKRIKIVDKLWIKFLKSNTPKAAHNLQMEEEWSYWQMGVPVNNWKICTMNSSHCLDNRAGITSLKFQTCVNFGIFDYDSHISSYLKSVNKDYGANSLNKIFEFIDTYGYEELLKYNAYDSYWGLLLAVNHINQLNL